MRGTDRVDGFSAFDKTRSTRNDPNERASQTTTESSLRRGDSADSFTMGYATGACVFDAR